jgi:phosphoesterase RecJ-like protein
MCEPPAELLAALTADPRPIVAGHVTPDADCLASVTCLAKGIEQACGSPVLCAIPDGSVSDRIQFMIDWAQPHVATPEQCHASTAYAVCDTAKAPRTNVPDGINKTLTEGRRVINIDHHASNTEYGEINWIDSKASSAAEMVYRIFVAAGWTIDPTVASLLYVGIHSDTVGFSLSNTPSTALAAAGHLVELGADVGQIGKLLCRSLSKKDFDFRRTIYDNTRLSATGRIAFSTASHYEITRAGCTANDIDDQVEIPRSLANTEVVLLFTEGVPGQIRINLRSEGDLSVLELARQLGGGGHIAAAGAIINGSIEDAVSKLLPMTEQFIDQLRTVRG